MKGRIFVGAVEFYILGPIVVVLVCMALWLSMTATYENYRLGRVSDQIMRVVSVARDMKFPKKIDPDSASTSFFKRFKQTNESEVEQISGAFMGRSPQWAIVTPWDETMRVYFYPLQASLRIETKTSFSACRRLLLLYAKAVGDLGLRRVDIKPDSPLAVWRLVYEEPNRKESRILEESAIYSGCGDSSSTLVSLTFSL